MSACPAVGQGWLEQAVVDGTDRDARWHMMMTAQEGAIAFVKPLGAAHAMSHACSRLPGLSLNHGLLNAICLPEVMRFNAGAAPEKEARLRIAMNIRQNADLGDAIAELNARLGIPAGLSGVGVRSDMMADLVGYSMRDICHRGNVRAVTETDYEAMFTRLLAA
jgi:4-hydroxybutyrate dehydrogenase